ncbi:MAG: argininosuccinate lyase [Deltaproteobacteria bacterium]|nr:argininosuccinate lyase [Deltaproteobacteria bacterium]
MAGSEASKGEGQGGATAMSIARTAATSGAAMVPELLAWTSSYEHDRSLVREDLLGSAAHVTMLGRQGILAKADAATLRAALLAMDDAARAGTLSLPDGEEDVHMAIESKLTRDLGELGKRLHAARSRNDQVALALRLHVRDQATKTAAELAALVLELVVWARRDLDVILPAYTHRQRAQPVSAAFLIAAWCRQLLRACEAVEQARARANESPLGCGACSGTSLPIDRGVAVDLLQFAGMTANALDTIGDRDFELDFTWAGARVLLATSRLATDVIDFTTSEFGFLKIGDAIAAGSSMMPQKKNPDVFELVRGKTGRGIGNLTAMLTLVKGLPSGYARDLQDDRAPTLETGPLVRGALRAVRAAHVHLAFDREACLRGVADGSTQATDVAEALVRKGMPFREAYMLTGRLVQNARERGVPLASYTVADAKAVDAAFDDAVLAVLDPKKAVQAKRSQGGTAPERVEEQLSAIELVAGEIRDRAADQPSFDALRARIEQVVL